MGRAAVFIWDTGGEESLHLPQEKSEVEVSHHRGGIGGGGLGGWNGSLSIQKQKMGGFLLQGRWEG